ncbi:ankyrin-3-like [Sesamum indicum]|uniref:Ankyrin-3-like n=1 Tax=Sesamum indicum TaxID=4182 RepID=A0A6I9T9C1_SESIN|nr:ankyrin-3-like [Sesamum indicum]
MDRLIKPDVQTVDLFFNRGVKCSQTFKLTNLMHAMPVAISLTTSNPQILSFHQPFSILPPLSTSSFLIQLNKPFDQPPLSTPPATILVRSSTLPTGKAHQDDLRRLFSKPGPHIFKDATLPIHFVGPQAAEFLLTSSFETIYINSVFSKAISCCDESQLTSLLSVAAINGNSHFISALIEAGADVNDRDPEGESIMSLAVKSGKADAVQVLIQSGYVIDNMIDRFLHVAAAMNKVDILEILCLSYMDIDLDSVNSRGQTALHLAAIHGQVEAMQFLVSVGSNVDSTDCFGWSPLHYAAQEGHFEAVEFLLNHLVYSKYAVTKEGQTAFALAVERGNSDLYDSLCLGDLLQRAARIDDVHAIKSCLDQGADINGRDQNGWTPLHRAAFKGNIESVKVLVSQGARVDVVDGWGYTPLLRAVEAGNVEVAVYLLSRGAKANLKSLKGRLPCDFECLKNHPSLVIPLDQAKEMD